MSTNPRLTDRDHAALEFLREWFIDNRVGPTTLDLGTALGVSKGTASVILNRLDLAGIIRYRPRATSRALRVIMLEEAAA